VAQGLIIVLLTGLTAGIIEGPQRGWDSPLIVACFAASAAACALLVPHELRRREPLLDVRFFRSVPFSGATATAVAAFGALSGFLFLNTLYLQTARGYSPLAAGLLTLPMAGTSALCAPLSGRLVGHGRARWALMLAGAAIAAGAGSFVALRPATPLPELIVAYVILGAGFGLVNPPISNAAVSGMPKAQAGVAAAVASTSRQVGSVLGVAVTGSLIAGAGAGNFVTASQAGWLVIAVCGLWVAGMGLLTTSHWARRSAAQARELLIDPPEDADRDVTSKAA
jgi:MFS family permease